MMIGIRILGTDATGQPDDNIRYWLAGDPALPIDENPGISDEQRNIPRESDDSGGPGHPYKTFVDRENASVQMSFDTSRLFDSILECWRWRNSLSYLDEALRPHPFGGDVVMRAFLPGDTFEDVIIKGCVLGVTGLTPNGKTVQIGYQLKGSYIEPYATGAKAVLTGLVTFSYFLDFSTYAEGDLLHVFFGPITGPGGTHGYVEIDTDATVLTTGTPLLTIAGNFPADNLLIEAFFAVLGLAVTAVSGGLLIEALDSDPLNQLVVQVTDISAGTTPVNVIEAGDGADVATVLRDVDGLVLFGDVVA